MTSGTALRVYVSETGARCPACAYSLSGLENDRCPECGQGLRLTLAKASRSWAWVYGLFGLALGEGLLALALGTLVMMVVAREWYEYPEAAAFSAILLVALAAQSMALARWIVHRDNVSAGRAVLAWTVSAGLGAVVWLAAAVMSVL